MKKFWLLVAVVAISLAAGCVGEVKTYTDSGQAISIGVNQEFIIALGSNPTTGYGWQESYDEAVLELVEKTYKAGAERQSPQTGQAGQERLPYDRQSKSGSAGLGCQMSVEPRLHGLCYPIIAVLLGLRAGVRWCTVAPLPSLISLPNPYQY